MKGEITINKLCVAHGKADALENISFKIKKGEFAVIIGPNGGGKTTLLDSILGFLKPQSGNINTYGSKLSYVPQTAVIDRDFPISVLETVMTAFLNSGLNPFKIFSRREKEKALELLSGVGLEALAKNKISALSGGEFQRLLIARALGAEPDILLLDEPTANVDAASRDKIFSLLKALNQKGLTIVTVTHDLAAAENFASSVICLNRELTYYGAPITAEKAARLIYNQGGSTSA